MTTPAPSPLTAAAPAAGDFDHSVLAAGVERILEMLQRLHDDRALPPVLSQVTPGRIAAQLPPRAPATAETLETILADVERVIVPGITHWHHPSFMAYFANSSSVPSLLGEVVTSALNANAMLWVTSPAATELEQRVLQWLWTAMGLPDADAWFGIITDTASMSTLLAIAAAREAAGFDVRQRGMAGRSDLPVMRVYCSEHTHSSIDKACITLGLGTDNVIKIPVDDDFRMRADALAAA
ncbi:MAG TPA: pyridoxal-dependent decarboxylase, partial [Gemmatimonadaceae bacterium]|nr:pyridoxal-dependent decarboxylase [Gemmatimonadaceae bacterium]